MELTCAARCPCLHRRAASRSAASFPEAAGSSRARLAAPCCVPQPIPSGDATSRNAPGNPHPARLFMPPPLFIRLFMRSGEPPDCGVKCRQSPPLVEASGRGEFPGRGTADIPEGDDRSIGRFMPPGRCAGLELENFRHPAPSEFEGRAIPPLPVGEDIVPRAPPLSLHILTWRPALRRTRAEALKALVVPGTGSPFSLLCRSVSPNSRRGPCDRSAPSAVRGVQAGPVAPRECIFGAATLDRLPHARDFVVERSRRGCRPRFLEEALLCSAARYGRCRRRTVAYR